LETAQFHVADAFSLFGKDPIALHYVAVILARRLDNANQALIELKSQLQAGEPRSEIDKTVIKIQAQIICAGGASLIYAGYPFDPYGENPAVHRQ
jgi:hypothetical protein